MRQYIIIDFCLFVVFGGETDGHTLKLRVSPKCALYANSLPSPRFTYDNTKHEATYVCI